MKLVIFILALVSFCSAFAIEKSKVFIIEDCKAQGSPFNYQNDCKNYKLKGKELDTCLKLVENCIKENNQLVSKNKLNKKSNYINLDKYYFQVISVINDKNEIEIWVNALCSRMDWSVKYLKTNVLRVDDGGKCFFNLTINLTQKKFFGLSINGYA